MAQRTLNLGSLTGFHIFDDSTGLVSVETDGAIRTSNTPVNTEDVMRLNDVGGGGAIAPSDADYVVLSLDGDLSNERVLAVGDGLGLTDGGANGNVTIDAEDAKRYTLLLT